MTDPKRPDVDAIEARADIRRYSPRVRIPGDADWLAHDILELIAYIRKLEEAVEAEGA